MEMREFVRLLHVPAKESHKGQNGKLLIIGGSKRYHGAAMLSVLAARRFVDLVYFYPGERDERLIDAIKTIPEVIVMDSLERIEDVDCVLFGIGLNEAKIDSAFILENVKRIVIDGDGLKRVKGRIPKGAVLTPHEREFRALFGKTGTKKNVKEMAAKFSCVILKKGPIDIISDGKKIVENTVHNPGMTKGGTGDVLSGLVAALACKNKPFEAAVAGAYINGFAGNMLKKRFGYHFCASDLAEELAPACHRIMGV